MTPETIRGWLEGRGALTTAPFGEGALTPPEIHCDPEAEVLAALQAAMTPHRGAALALSGGIDASLLACLMAEQGPLQTWTLQDPATHTDELSQARQVARALNAEHQEVTLTADALRAGFADAVRACGVPLFNGRAVARHLFWQQLARAGVTHAMSGVGADEVFLGDPLGTLPDAQGLMPFERWRSRDRAWAALLMPEVSPPAPGSPLPVGPAGCQPALAWMRTTMLPALVLPLEQGAAAPIKVALPYLSPAVVRLGRGLSVETLVEGELGKMPLRRLLRARLPAPLGDRLASLPKVRRYAPPDPGWAEALAPWLSHAHLKALPGVHPGAATRLLARLGRLAVDDPEHGPLERVLTTLAALVILKAESSPR